MVIGIGAITDMWGNIMTKTPDTQRGQETVIGMHHRGPILRVDFSMDGLPHQSWNTEMRVDGLPMTPVTDRQLDDAILAANEFRDIQPFMMLKKYRGMRAGMVRQHFLICAQKMINSIEAEEPWEYWYDRLRD